MSHGIGRMPGHRSLVRASLVVLLAATPLAAQEPRRLTAEDYARAERFLPANVNPLVTGVAGPPNWLDDGRFWSRARTSDGMQYVLVEPARGTKRPAFDHARLAAALASASGGSVEATSLNIQTLRLSRTGGEATAMVGGKRYSCDLTAYTCGSVDDRRPPYPAPRASVTSPDGRYAAYIRDHNLWVRDLTTGEDRQLTTDGVEDFGYATNNAGWYRSDLPVLLWSPDSKKIATFQHDSRGVSMMYLVTTNVGAPRLEAWRYALPSDSVIFRIHRVVIEVETGRVIRLQMPPDAHRSTISDHIAEGSRFLDVQWYPDASHLAFVSSSRDHKHAILRIANASTGEVRTVLEERS
ncbi:MAG TPA: DPP IV N-terminal domain-containing protein, partial [Longimicrobiales bacterium]|nr:DPP IV N-terminal domain-containing protein [Longimicrobiales bacterium]